MGKHKASSAWQPDPGDAVSPDVAAAVGAEEFNEDRLGLDPLEEAMDPPEDWVGSNSFGVTVEEQREGESLEQRLAQEEADDIDIDELEAPTEDDASRQVADEAGGSVARAWRTPDPGTE